MNKDFSSDAAGMGAGASSKPQWRAPVLTMDSIHDTTRHFFSAGIDNYEVDNPVGYGAS
jgi:hypothetical protein